MAGVVRWLSLLNPKSPARRHWQAVLRSYVVASFSSNLRENGIEVTALHSHMLDNQPRLFLMHFWANDDVAKLAKGLRTTLDQVNRERS